MDSENKIDYREKFLLHMFDKLWSDTEITIKIFRSLVWTLGSLNSNRSLPMNKPLRRQGCVSSNTS